MSIPHQSSDLANIESRGIDSVCVYCGSSNAADPAWLEAAAVLGAALAAEGLRLVYGGGGVGLMGACARAAHAAGGRVLGVIPHFLAGREVVLDEVETVIVSSMHERKIRMFEAADAFVVLPGAIGTLEEAVELLSWRRLGLHAKPIVFYDPGGFWRPLFELFEQFIADRLVPAEFRSCWEVVERIEDVIPALRAMPAGPTVAPVMRVVA
jgi:uncharacterized protein (TIGR00730 family)